MKALKVVAIAAVAAGMAHAAELAPEAGRSVTICVDPGAHGSEVYSARRLVSGLFAKIGVKVDWRERAACPPDGSALLVSLSDKTPDNQRPGALAYALPYEGSHLVVFYDRVHRLDSNPRNNLLAYTFAHEITHILEGISRHSESGIMKAHWDYADRYDMRMGRLSFAAADADLILRGLESRERQSAPVPQTQTAAPLAVAVQQ
jgi:hypothetical protein